MLPALHSASIACPEQLSHTCWIHHTEGAAYHRGAQYASRVQSCSCELATWAESEHVCVSLLQNTGHWRLWSDCHHPEAHR